MERWRRSSAARVCIGHAHLRESCARPCAHGMESRQALSMWEAGRAVAKENLARVCVVGVRGRGQWEARARTSSASWGAQHQATCRMILAMCTFVRRECVRRGKNRAWGRWCTARAVVHHAVRFEAHRTCAHAGGSRSGSSMQSKRRLAARLGARSRARAATKMEHKYPEVEHGLKVQIVKDQAATCAASYL